LPPLLRSCEAVARKDFRMDIQRFFERIQYDGAADPDLTTLADLQRTYVCSVPFENLDVQLGKPLSIEVEDAYDKIVLNGRGGWCYEQNGLFGWALSEIGFDVTRVAASVMREQRGPDSDGTHLCLIVKLPDSRSKYLVDVGFGGSMLRPIPLRAGEHEQPPYSLTLERLDKCSWRFSEDVGTGQFSFDFSDNSADESLLSSKSEFQQTDASSKFVKNLVVKRRFENEHAELRGRVLKEIRVGSVSTEILSSAEELSFVLEHRFGLAVPDVMRLWPEISARHESLFAATL